ncbi:MAG: winged helix DNA-binding protein [Thermoleophilia bacterium]
MTPDNPTDSPAPGPARRGPPSLGTQLVVLGQDLADLFERVCRPYGVSRVGADILALLAANDPEPMEPWQVGQVLGLQSNHLTMLFDRLVGEGLVERAVHPTDRRRRLVRLTDAGADSCAVLAASLVSIERQLLDAGLTADEQARLAALCTRLRNGMRESIIPQHQTRPGP